MTSPHLLLVAGPSGSGKSRLGRLGAEAGHALPLSLDEFYLDVDQPGLPMTDLGIPDWDDARTWDCELAVATLGELLREGRADVPTYSISESRRTGHRTVELGNATCVVAEGIFALDALAPLRAAGIPVDAIWLDRLRSLNFGRRLARDLSEHRKPPMVLVRRGLALRRHEPALRQTALDAGFRPVTMPQAMHLLTSPR